MTLHFEIILKLARIFLTMVCENDFAMQWQFVLKGNEGRAYAPPLYIGQAAAQICTVPKILLSLNSELGTIY